MSTALITGITGQDGYYLSKLLLEKGYEVHGTVRRSSTFNTSRIESLISEYGSQGKLQLHYSDLLDSTSLNTLISTIKPINKSFIHEVELRGNVQSKKNILLVPEVVGRFKTINVKEGQLVK